MVKVLAYRQDQKAQIGHNDPELGKQVLPTVQGGDFQNGWIDRQGYLRREGIVRQRQRDEQEKGENGEPMFAVNGAKEDPFHQEDHEWEGETVLLRLHGEEGGEKGGKIPDVKREA